jgi:hypothetical protein
MAFRMASLAVLDRHIQIMQDLRLIRDRFDQFIRDLFRIAVQNTDPFDTVDST